MPASTIVVGKAQIIALLDTPMQFPWHAFFPGLDRAQIDAYKDLYPGSFGKDMFATQAGAYAIRSEGKTILCDTGVGPGPHDWLGGLRGNLVSDMESKGISPDEVDVVAFTHLHGDHVGWNLTPGGKPTFSRATYLVPQADWDFFKSAMHSNPQMQLVVPLEEAGVMELVSGEKAITGEVTTYPTPGHTPGHQSIMVSSDGERALVCGDLAHHPAQVDRIEWCSGFDMDHPTTTETRRKVFAQLEADGIIAGFCHFPEAPFGKLIRLEGRSIWKAIG